MNLVEWSKQYIKFKDCLKKQIVEIEEKENTLVVKEKKETKIFLILNELDNQILNLKEENKTYVITENTKKNINFLSENWSVIEKTNITIIFTNIKTNESWIIHPQTHAKISENKTIKQGLNSLYESITKV